MFNSFYALHVIWFHYEFLDCREYYETEYIRLIGLIRESTNSIFMSTSDEEIDDKVGEYINSMRILKINLFFTARILLRVTQQITNETRQRFNGQTGDFIKKRMQFLGRLRERLSVLLSPDTLTEFMNPDTCTKNIDLATLALAMVSHTRLGGDSALRHIDDELLNLVMTYSFPIKESFPVSKRPKVFNANKYCSFSLAYNMQNDTDTGRKLERWMLRSDVLFQEVNETFYAPPASAEVSTPTQISGASAHSTPDSEYSPESTQTVERFRSAGYMHRLLF
jgi:hypothetical protein